MRQQWFPGRFSYGLGTRLFENLNGVLGSKLWKDEFSFLIAEVDAWEESGWSNCKHFTVADTDSSGEGGGGGGCWDGGR